MYFQSLVVMQVSKRNKEKRHLREVKSKKEEKLERKKKTTEKIRIDHSSIARALLRCDW